MELTQEKPLLGYFLSLIGGSFTLLMGAAATNAGLNLSRLTGTNDLSPAAGPILTGGLAASAGGAAILLASAILYKRPSWHTPLGALMISMSLLSWVGTINLFSAVPSSEAPLAPIAILGLAGSLVFVQIGIIGLPLGLVGGILSLEWKPLPTRAKAYS